MLRGGWGGGKRGQISNSVAVGIFCVPEVGTQPKSARTAKYHKETIWDWEEWQKQSVKTRNLKDSLT